MAQKKEDGAAQAVTLPVARLQTLYSEKVVAAMTERFKYGNVMNVPKLQKISINIGVGEAASEPKLLETALQELTQIAGQKPQIRKSKKAISNFKLREGQAIGCRVTLRRKAMYEFLDRFCSLGCSQDSRFPWFARYQL